jgi:putative FmdB family regulatory protein
MLTYEYKCNACGKRFELRQVITEAPLTECPECLGEVCRLVSGGAGFILKGSDRGGGGPRAGACSLEQVGKTCCGRDERCESPHCGG